MKMYTGLSGDGGAHLYNKYKTKGWGGGQGRRGREETDIEQWNLKVHQSEPLSIRVGFAKQTMVVCRHIFSFPDPPLPSPSVIWNPHPLPWNHFYTRPNSLLVSTSHMVGEN